MRVAAVLLLTVGLSACMEPAGTIRVDGTYASPARPVVSPQIGETTYRAVDRLVDSGAYRLNPAGTIAVGTFIDRQAPGANEAFGSFVADLVRTRLVQRGLIVTEPHPPSLIPVGHRTSRPGRVRRSRAAMVRAAGSEVVMGTYLQGPELTYVSLKVVSSRSNRILAAVDFAVPRTR